MATVMSYDDACILDGEPSTDLVRASLAAAPTGAVRAYQDDAGIWQHVRASDESLHDIQDPGRPCQTVYVDDIDDEDDADIDADISVLDALNPRDDE